MRTITAITSTEPEFFKVVNWCYDIAEMGHLVRAVVGTHSFSLSLTLPTTDARLGRFETLVADRSIWTVLECE